MKLDIHQQKAAFQNYPYSIIIAGAGTGKTHTLLGRIFYLVEELGMNPKDILVISYTNETVEDFQKKVLNQLGFSVTVLTFHKLALFLLDQTSKKYSICSNDMLSYVIEEFFHSFIPSVLSLQRHFLRLLFPFFNYYWKKFRKYQNAKDIREIQKYMIQFIHMWYAKGYSKEQFTSLIMSHFGRKKSFYLLTFLGMNLYERELQSQNLIDFDSMISLAIEAISDLKNFSFQHILIDEFQDSSFVRMTLFITLVKTFHLHFTVVGDDCQSIYRFSGTAPDCFSLLKNSFPNVHFFYLKYTYRNSQELISMANHFILKNKRQMQKEICSGIHVDYPIEILFYRKRKDIFKILHYISFASYSSILFLGRNSFDWKYYFQDDEIIWKDKKHFLLHQFPQITFTFMTVHQSKGLEADVVILLHLENGIYGFPNQVKNPSYFACFQEKNEISFEEERRLFYVALTRTKGKVFLVTPFWNPSFFVQELRKDFKKKIKVSFF